MANGLGEYFSQTAMLEAPPGAQPGAPAPAPTAGALPQFAPPPSRTSVLATPPSMEQISGTGMGYFGPTGMGAYNAGPVPGAPRRPGGFRRAVSRVSPFAGALGDASDAVSDAKAGAITGVAAATTVTVILIGMGLRFGSGWIVGKALAPSGEDEGTYAWGGALASTFFGAVGLGVTALVAGNARK
jgi:Na+-driven multidrug efflux pump